MSDKISVSVRWMIRRDMPEVLEIERNSYEDPYTEDELHKFLRHRLIIGMVAEYREKVVGFMIYELHKHKISVLDMTVAEQYRRRGVGTQMVNKLINKLSEQARNRVVIEVDEYALDGQLFLSSCGFKAESIVKDNSQEYYKFVYRTPKVDNNHLMTLSTL